MDINSVNLQVDEGADGLVDSLLNAPFNKIQTADASINLSLNQNSYKKGDVLTLGISVDNPRDSLVVDTYFILINSEGEIISLPGWTPSLKPVVTDYQLAEKLEISEIPVVSVTIPSDFTWDGQILAIAAITYPGTPNLVNEKYSVVSFTLEKYNNLQEALNPS